MSKFFYFNLNILLIPLNPPFSKRDFHILIHYVIAPLFFKEGLSHFNSLRDSPFIFQSGTFTF